MNVQDKALLNGVNTALYNNCENCVMLKGMDNLKGEDVTRSCGVEEFINKAIEECKGRESLQNGLSGAGVLDDNILFAELFKFLKQLGQMAGMQIETIKDVRSALSSGYLTSRNVESAYAQATGKHLSFAEISKRVGKTMKVIELVTLENYEMYQKLVGVSEKYMSAVNKARESTRDIDFRNVLDDLHRQFETVKRYIQFISQRQLKAQYVPPVEEYTYDDQEKQLFTTLLRLQRVLKFCFTPDKLLAQKFISKLNQYASKDSDLSYTYLVRLLQKSPLVINSQYFQPQEIISALERAYEQLQRFDNKRERSQYLSKLTKLTQKIMSEKMSTLKGKGISDSLGDDDVYMPQSRTAFQTVTRELYAKDQRINIFKHKISHFYILIIKQFMLILDKKHYQDLAKLSQDLQLTVTELVQVQQELLDSTEQDINAIIKNLRKDEINSQLEYNSSLYRLKYIREMLLKKNKDLSAPFATIVNKIADLIENLLRYLQNTIKKGVYTSPDDILDVEHYGLDALGDQQIQKQVTENTEWLDFINNYLTVAYMRQNLSRVKREIESIDETVYYQKTTYNQLQHLYNECDRFYAQVENFYLKPEDGRQIRCDPQLAKYLYHIALRFQSSMYITKGRSTHPAFNPRYFLFDTTYHNDAANDMNAAAQFPAVVAFNGASADTIKQTRSSVKQLMDGCLDIFVGRNIEPLAGTDLTAAAHVAGLQDIARNMYASYKLWTKRPKFIGLAEELGAHKMKADCISIKNTGSYNDAVPIKPKAFEEIEKAFDSGKFLEQHIYDNLHKNPFLYNITSANPLIARTHFYQLMRELYRSGVDYVKDDANVNVLYRDSLGQDELKYLFAFKVGVTSAQILALQKPDMPSILSSTQIDKLITKPGTNGLLEALQKCVTNIAGAGMPTERNIYKALRDIVTESITDYNLLYTSLAGGGGFSQVVDLDDVDKFGKTGGTYEAQGQKVIDYIQKELVLKNKSRTEIAIQLYKKVQEVMIGAPGCPPDAVPLPVNNGTDFNAGIDAMLKVTRDYTDIRASNNASVLFTGGGLYQYTFGAIAQFHATVTKHNTPTSMYDILKQERSSIIQQLMYNQNVPTHLDASDNDKEKKTFYILQRVFKLLEQMQSHDMYKDKRDETDKNVYVSCMNNDNLKEYLIPQIQLPFINPSLGDAAVDYQNVGVDGVIYTGSGADYNNHYYATLIEQYGRQVTVTPAAAGTKFIQAGMAYSVGQYMDSKRRMLFDSAYRTGATYTIGAKLPIMPMFGSYLFMPVLKHQTTTGVTMNQEKTIEGAYLVRNHFDKVLNCFMTDADRNTSRDYIKGLNQQFDWSAKRNSVYFAIDQSVDYDQVDRSSTVFKSLPNAFFEYQMFMAQQLQYFTVHGCKFIFDPLIRKQVFEVANKIYRGIPLSKFDDNMMYEGAPANVYVRDREQEPAFYLTKVFGQLQKIKKPINLVNIPANPYIINNRNDYSDHYQVQAYKPPKGFFPISDSYIQNQPRLAMGIYLKECPVGSSVKEEFIARCYEKDPHMVKSDVLKVNDTQFAKLLEVLDEDKQRQMKDVITDLKKERFRVYLSECIRLQYHSNACVLERTEPILVAEQNTNAYALEDFLPLLKRVLKIKKRGYRALLQLAEQVDQLLSAEVRASVASNLKFADLKAMMEKLIIYQRTQDADKQVAKKIAPICLNVNQYLSIYGKSSNFQSIYKQRPRKLAGQGAEFLEPALYSYDLQKYYTGIGEYLDSIQREIQQDMNINNFVDLFVRTCQSDGNERLKKINATEVRGFVVQYLMSSAIDVDTSLLETDFAVKRITAGSSAKDLLNSIDRAQKNTAGYVATKDDDERAKNNWFKQQLESISQYEFDVNEKMRLVGIDAIFIPQNWQVSTSYEETTLVPRNANECTQELDFLYNNIMNAMAQKLINVLGLYRLQERKKAEIVLPRILLGAGKKAKRSRSLGLEEIQPETFNKTSDFESKRMELYYRVYLLCKYYFNLFSTQKQNAKAKSVHSNPILLFLKPTADQHEGKLIKYVFQLMEKKQTLTTNQVHEFMHYVDKIASYRSARDNFHAVYEAIVEYINKNYGLVTYKEQQMITKLEKRVNDNTNGVDPEFDKNMVLSQLAGVDTYDDSYQSLLKVMDEEKEPVAYVNAEGLKQFLQERIEDFSKMLKSRQGIDKIAFESGSYSLARLFRALRFEYLNKPADQKVIKLRQLINSDDANFQEHRGAAVHLHENVMFAINLVERIKPLVQLAQKDAPTDADVHGMMKIYTRCKAQDATDLSNLQAQLAHVLQHSGLIDVSTQKKPSAKSTKLEDFVVDHKFNTSGLARTLKQLKNHVVTTVKLHKEASKQIKITVPQGASSIEEVLYDAVVTITKYFDDVIDKLDKQEQFTNKTLTGGARSDAEEQKEYNKLQDSYFKNIGANNKVDIRKVSEVQHSKPYPGYILSDKNDGDQQLDLNTKGYWQELVDGQVINHQISKEGDSSVAAPGGAPVVIAPPGPGGVPVAPPGGAPLNYAKGYLQQVAAKLPNGNLGHMKGGVNAPATVTVQDYNAFIQSIATHNQKRQGIAVKNSGFQKDNTLVKISTKVGGLTPILGLNQLVLVRETVIMKGSKALVVRYFIPDTSISQETAQKLVTTGTSQAYTVAGTLALNLIKEKDAIEIQLGTIDSIKHEFTIVPIYNTDKIVTLAYLNRQTDAWSDIAHYPTIAPFTNREVSTLRGTGIGKSTRPLGLDQMVLTAYDCYPEPTLQFNSIIKYLIQETGVISSIPRSFVQLFQGIWNGVGSQTDYEMVVQYKRKHLDDFRAKEQMRIQNDNYINDDKSKTDIKITFIRYRNKTGNFNQELNNMSYTLDARRNVINIKFRAQLHDSKSLQDYDIDVAYDSEVDYKKPYIEHIIDVLDPNVNLTTDVRIYFNNSKSIDNTNKYYRVGQELLDGVVYDGFQTGMLLYTPQELFNHNQQILNSPTGMRTHYTSSVLHFCSKLLEQCHMLDKDSGTLKTIPLDAGKIPVLQHDTNVQIASSCVYAKVQLEAILEQIDMQLRSLDMISLYDLDDGERAGALTQLNQKISYLNVLKQTILRFKSGVDEFVDSKKDALTGFLSDTKNVQGEIKTLVSNFDYICRFDPNSTQQLDNMQAIIFARYLHERSQRDGQDILNMMSKQYGTGFDVQLMNIVEPMIWMLVQANLRLKCSSLVQSGLKSEIEYLVSDEQEPLRLSQPSPSRQYEGGSNVVSSKLEETLRTYLHKYTKALTTSSTKPHATHTQGTDDDIVSLITRYITDTEFKGVTPINPALIIQCLDEFKHVQYALPSRNRDIMQRISQMLLRNQQKHDTKKPEDINVVDIGIVPINLNMMKKDIGLFHVFFNATLYREFLKDLQLNKNKDFADLDKGLMGLKLSDVKDMALITTGSYLENYISKELQTLVKEREKPENADKMVVLTKSDQFRYELQMRFAISMYALVKYLLRPTLDSTQKMFTPINAMDALQGLYQPQ